MYVSKLTLLTILVTFLTPSLCSNHKKIVIVGAGPSGIAAATRLYENNITDILILEAENRIGGRIYTEKLGNATVELGAEFCHGEVGNVVYELANNYDLLKPLEVEPNFYYSSGESIDDTLFESLYEKLYNFYESPEKDNVSENASIGQYLAKRFNEELVVNYRSNNKQLRHSEHFYDYFMNAITSLDGAFSIFDVSVHSSYEQCEGNQQIIWKHRGYKTILDILMKKYPNPEEELPILNKVLFNKEVAEINWNDVNTNADKNVVVKCADGSNYTADHVIFTPSLGVLKNNHDSIFKPHLPKEKIDAIEKLGIAAVSKIYLHFPKKWWPDEELTTFSLIWRDEDKKMLAEEFPHGPIKDGYSWLTHIANFIGVQNNSVLVAWVVGDCIPEIEKLPDDIVIDGITYILEKFLKKSHPEVCKPDAILRNNWYTNPHFRGVYSYERAETHKNGVSLQEFLEEPLTSNDGNLKILFAGEATHTNHYSTVHGAIETGFREAQRIIDSNY